MSIDDESIAILEAISKRNPGALRVCFELIEYLQELVIFDFEMLKKMNVLGSDLWDLYKACDYKIEQTHTSITQQNAIEKLRSIPGSTFYEEASQ